MFGVVEAGIFRLTEDGLHIVFPLLSAGNGLYMIGCGDGCLGFKLL